MIDPIFAVKKLFLIDKKNLDCNKKIKVFDGNIFYYLIMKKENTQLDFDSVFSNYKGKLNKCILTKRGFMLNLTCVLFNKMGLF